MHEEIISMTLDQKDNSKGLRIVEKRENSSSELFLLRHQACLAKRGVNRYFCSLA